MPKTSRIKLIVIFLTFFTSIVFFVWLLKDSAIRPRAAGDEVDITFVPTTNTFLVNQIQTLTVILQTSDSSKKISGLDLSFTANERAQIIDVGVPVPLDGPNAGSPTFFAQLTKNVSPTSGRISAVNQSTDDQQLSHIVSVRISFKGGAVGPGDIILSSAQVVGNISSTTYTLGIVEGGNYTFTSPPSLVTHPIKKTSSPPVLDGSLSEFGQAQSISFGSPTNNSVIVKAMWDDSHLYLGYIVRDYQLNFLSSQRDGNLWEDDAVEWFIDTLNNGGGSQTPDQPYMLLDDYQGIVNINNTQFDSQGSASGVPVLSWNGIWQSAVLKGGTVNTNDDTDSGYTVEIKIPWTSVGFTTAPTAETIFGMSFAVDDKDANSIASAMWPGITTVFQNSSKWQKAQLMAGLLAPTLIPSLQPTQPVPSPFTTAYLPAPTTMPTQIPTLTPTRTPTSPVAPTNSPTASPTSGPSLIGNSIPTIPEVLTFLIRGFFLVAGLGAGAYLSLGAYSWITSGGDPEMLQKAKGKMVAAIVGLVLIVGVVSVAAVFEQVVFSQKICFGISCPLELPQLIK